MKYLQRWRKTVNTVYLIRIPFVISTLLMFNGCGILGFSLGSAHDAHAHDTLRTENIRNLQSGSNIFLLKTDDTTVEGEFRGLERLSTLQNDRDSLFGAPITFFSLASGVRRSGQLTAFDGDTVWIRLNGNQESSQFSRDKVKDILDNQNQVITPERLRIIASNLPPLFQEVITVFDGEMQKKVPTNKIKSIRLSNSRSLRWILLGSGLAIDAAVTGFLIGLHNTFWH
jgi:hypothetical protein